VIVRLRWFALAIGALVLVLGVQRAQSAPTELFISEYIEGSGQNKALEIYNGTGAAVDLGALGYSVFFSFNGGTSTRTIPLVGTVANGDVFVIAQATADQAILAQADQTDTSTSWFNGDDFVALRKSGATVDGIGQLGVDPSTEWGTGDTSTADNTIRRKATVERGDTNETDAFDPASEWNGLAMNTFDGLGSHAITTGGDAAPAVATSQPANGAGEVPVDSDVSVTFSEPVAVGSGWYSISCTSSGVHTATQSGGPQTFVLNPDADFVQGESCTVRIDAAKVADVDTDDPPDQMGASQSFTFTTMLPLTQIAQVQGTSHPSPLAGQLVKVEGVVTAERGSNVWVQDTTPDGDPATSEGILVFGSAVASAVAVGDLVQVRGTVQEFRAGCTPSCAPDSSAFDNLTVTEIGAPGLGVSKVGTSPRPAATVIGVGGRVPPTTIIEDDSASNVESGNVFDPTQDGIDFYESLESMRVQVNNPVAVGPSNGFREIFVLADDGANAPVRTARGGIVIRPTDFNPERIQLDDAILPGSTGLANVGDHFSGPAVGILGYDFGNFELDLTSPLTTVSNGVTREVTTTPAENQLAVATFNVENLDANESQSKFDTLADEIVDNLQSPDLIALEEIQDNNGAVDDGVVNATLTLDRLKAAVVDAGGPAYEWRQIDPVDDQDGGEPGGNIRVGFFFRTDRGLRFVDVPGGDATTPTQVVRQGSRAHLTLSPGRVDPLNPAWAATRKPLAGEFVWNDKTLIVIANHFSSKGGDDPLYGRFQPPVQSTAPKRHEQAVSVNAFVRSILAAERKANVVVLGDINDFDFSETTQILESGGVISSLMHGLPQSERYSYVFEGNSQVLDQVLFSPNMLRGLAAYDVVHVNSEFAEQASDHDPSVARVKVLGGGGG
jgi:predicted extracellular nuclease